MKEIESVLIIGDGHTESPDFFDRHLLFWLRQEKIQCDFHTVDSFSHDKKYDYVIITKNYQLSDYGAKEIESFYNSNIDTLHSTLLNANSNNIIYIDFSYSGVEPLNDISKNLKKISTDMVKSYCLAMQKNYFIFHIYDIIGYKFYGSSGVNINYWMESKVKGKFIFSGLYENIHFVFIHDAIKAILKTMKSEDIKFKNAEHHLRYNNKGTNIKKIADLFQRTNHDSFFSYMYIDDNKKTAPFYGEPFELLTNDYPMEYWVKRKRTQEYF